LTDLEFGLIRGAISTITMLAAFGISGFFAYHFSKSGNYSLFNILGILIGIPAGIISGVGVLMPIASIADAFEVPVNIEYVVRLLSYILMLPIFGCFCGSYFGVKKAKNASNIRSINKQIDVHSKTTFLKQLVKNTNDHIKMKQLVNILRGSKKYFARSSSIIVIALILIIVGTYYLYFRTPSNYEECILQNIGEAQTDFAVRLIERTCRSQFPNPFDQFVPPGFTLDSRGP
jgi:hypothetical protein